MRFTTVAVVTAASASIVSTNAIAKCSDMHIKVSNVSNEPTKIKNVAVLKKNGVWKRVDGNNEFRACIKISGFGAWPACALSPFTIGETFKNGIKNVEIEPEQSLYVGFTSPFSCSARRRMRVKFTCENGKELTKYHPGPNAWTREKSVEVKIGRFCS